MLTVREPEPYIQPRLFEEPDLIEFPSPASARTRYGEVVEQIAIEALRAKDISIDGRYDVCYDACRGRGKSRVYYEIKSVKKSGACPIWNWRIEKDISTGLDVVYVFVLHNVTGANNSFELWDSMASTVNEIILAPLQYVRHFHSLSKDRSIHREVSNSRNGYERKGYCEGYRDVKMKSFRELIRTRKGRRFKVMGRKFNVQICSL